MDNVRVVRLLKELREENNFPSVVILELERDLKFHIHGIFGAPKRFKGLREENNFSSVVILELERDLKA